MTSVGDFQGMPMSLTLNSVNEVDKILGPVDLLALEEFESVINLMIMTDMVYSASSHLPQPVEQRM